MKDQAILALERRKINSWTLVQAERVVVALLLGALLIIFLTVILSLVYLRETTTQVVNKLIPMRVELEILLRRHLSFITSFL